MMLDLYNAIGKRKSTVWFPNSKSYLDMIIDSLIIAGITFFSSWNGTIDLNSILIVLKATGLSFFVQLSYEKGVKKLTKK